MSLYNLEDHEFEFEYDILQDDEQLPKILFDKRCDCIVADLNWGRDDIDDRGNQLIDKIVNQKRIPIIVVSGNLNLLSKNIEESFLFRKRQRDCDFNTVLEDIVDIYKTGYTTSLGSMGTLDEKVAEVFWEVLEENIDGWKNLDKGIKEQRLLRYLLTRVNEALAFYDDKHDKYNSVEVYIKPSLRSKSFTGDIIRYDDNYYVIMSAACDMENSNTDYVVMCKLEFEKFKKLVKKIRDVKEVSKSTKNELKGYINNSNQRYHLLPPCSSFSGGFIDFQYILTIARSELDENAIIEATISPQFVKDIQARFSHYYGRQGQPQLDVDEVINFIRPRH